MRGCGEVEILINYTVFCSAENGRVEVCRSDDMIGDREI